MNNDLYRTVNKNLEEGINEHPETRLAIALSRIVKNRDWKTIVEDMLMPRLEGARERADKSEGAVLFRAQGEITVLKFLIHLPAALQAQQNTIEHAQEETQ